MSKRLWSFDGSDVIPSLLRMEPPSKLLCGRVAFRLSSIGLWVGVLESLLRSVSESKLGLITWRNDIFQAVILPLLSLGSFGKGDIVAW